MIAEQNETIREGRLVAIHRGNAELGGDYAVYDIVLSGRPHDEIPPGYAYTSVTEDGRWHIVAASLRFQRGPVKEVGRNGITNEVLLEVVRHRLQCFQRGAYACPENATALASVEDALAALYARTKARTERGVEGTMAV